MGPHFPFGGPSRPEKSGDETLSGAAKDRNIGCIAKALARIGVDRRQARMVRRADRQGGSFSKESVKEGAGLMRTWRNR